MTPAPAPRPTGGPSTRPLPSRIDLAVCAGLLLVVFAVYGQVANFDFVYYDDPGYVTENPYVKAGLTWDSIKWAATSPVLGNWTPVTMLSHMLDCQLFGMRSGMHHLTNVLLHAVATLLLFAVLRCATGELVRSALVAAVFALHPLHVQSVAWVAERKDVLSASFFFLALYCYVLYAERPGALRYAWVMAALALGLMSKPMLVTFPFVLLLFDIWPLRRSRWPILIGEKLPLFALVALASAITYAVQERSGAMQAIPFVTRAENAVVSVVTYMGESFWPARLAVLYPYLKSIPLWETLAALACVLCVSAFAIGRLRSSPYFAVGWFWYLGTLAPVIGLVQVGLQAHADRYTYIPLVGLTIVVVWGGAELAEKAGLGDWIKPAAVTVALLLCVARTWTEISYWTDTETLFQHAIDVTEGNWAAEGDLGEYLMKQPDRRAEAMEHLEAALRIAPTSPEVENDLGTCLIEAGLCDQAIPHFEAALRVKPDSAQPLNNLGTCLMNTGKYFDSIPYFATAIRYRPDLPEIRLNLASALAKSPGRSQEAIGQFETALRLKPDYAKAHSGLGLLLASLGRTQEAIAHLEAAERIRSDPAITKALERLRRGESISGTKP